MNYFNYFTEIEETFVRRRGKHLLLSPMDWALIESWKEMKVPLHVALRGIERAFDSWEAKPRKRTVKSLLYCQEEVEAQFAEWLESRVGAETPGEPEAKSGTKAGNEGLPFPQPAIIEHLRRGRAGLLRTFEERRKTLQDDFTDALQRALNRLEELEHDFAESPRPEAEKLEASLTGLERMLSDAIRSTVSAEDLAAVQNEVSDQLRPYRKHMDKDVYEQTSENLLLKRLREQFGVPRLSLFYL